MPKQMRGITVVEIGSLDFGVNVNLESFRSGLSNLKREVDSAKNSARESFGEMERLGASVSSLGPSLLRVGNALAGTFLAIAGFGPATAPALATMRAELTRLSVVTSDALQPAFESISEAFTDFIDFISGDGKPILDTLNSVIVAVADGTSELLTNLGNLAQDFTTTFDIELGDGFNTLLEILGPGLLAAFIGYKIGGVTGAVAGAGLGLTIGGVGGDEFTNIDAAQTITGTTLTGAAIGSIVPGVGTGIGAGVGAIAGEVYVIYRTLKDDEAVVDTYRNSKHS